MFHYLRTIQFPGTRSTVLNTPLHPHTKQEAQLSLGKTDRAAYVRNSASEFQSRRESDLSEVKQFHARHVNGTLSSNLH